MMSTSSPRSLSFLKANEPEFAIVPRLFSRSSSVIPMPLSETVSVLFSLSIAILIAKSLFFIPTEVSVKDLKYSLSIASLAFEIISLRKISL